MTTCSVVRPREIVMGRLGYGSDLLEELTKLAVERGVILGRVEAIGAVRKARIGYYNQSTREYEFRAFDHPLEITKLTGNVSLKDGEPFVHAHVTLADESGQCRGGHLAPGTVVFACEFIIEAFDGPAFQRRFDDETGLALWSIEG